MTIIVNHNRNVSLERSAINHLGRWVGEGGVTEELQPVYTRVTLALASVVVHEKKQVIIKFYNFGVWAAGGRLQL